MDIYSIKDIKGKRISPDTPPPSSVSDNILMPAISDIEHTYIETNKQYNILYYKVISVRLIRSQPTNMRPNRLRCPRSKVYTSASITSPSTDWIMELGSN
jgi:hypothetical protein